MSYHGGPPDRVPDLGHFTAVYGKRLPERASPGGLLPAGSGVRRVGRVPVFSFPGGHFEAAPAAAAWRLHRSGIRTDSYCLRNSCRAFRPPADGRIQTGSPGRNKPYRRDRLRPARRCPVALHTPGVGEQSAGPGNSAAESAGISHCPPFCRLWSGASGRMAQMQLRFSNQEFKARLNTFIIRNS